MVLWQFWASQFKKAMEKLESFQKQVIEMIKLNKKWLRDLGLFSLEKKRLRQGGRGV